MKAEAQRAAEAAKASVSTPATTAEQLQAGEEPTTKTTKKQTAAEARRELADLKESAAATRQRLTKAEIQAQKARTILKKEASPGMSLQQDHYRLNGMIQDLRKLFEVDPEPIGG